MAKSTIKPVSLNNASDYWANELVLE